ncbi:polysaccharide lyase family 7 protein [Oceanihabitans sp. 2_MG-2023]|uniref:polysaccharide lyase family 7 protein n=1 Tax=Oceanihabitans sp. 2_MG-2023 TaxID=3062661 RepID=UPI0026E1C482|nr:polysaccharide lyase family 7 protein [Oceanihabitans sp. 2_MG-2023]MDO6596554.1 polysaccharide lyase family 7 protein [Oceanihabitans sp. 2_MG-2023]
MRIADKFYTLQLATILCVVLFFSCTNNEDASDNAEIIDEIIDNQEEEEEETIEYADIDFSNWKVTLPVDNDNNGGPDEYQPLQLINLGYQTLEPVQPYMYDDITDGSLVFYTFPDVSTTNSSYSRTELRELINPSNSRENWTLLEGGEMTGRLKVDAVSANATSSDDYHKVIVMQIHGVLSQEDMDIHGFSSNNGPPLIKIYWKDGYIWSHKKSLIDESTDGDDLLETSSNTWTDIKLNLGYVGFEAFDFRITASDAKIEVQLNNNAAHVYQDVSLNKWPYENYFKAGNYLNSTHADAFSYIKYYNLSITH